MAWALVALQLLAAAPAAPEVTLARAIQRFDGFDSAGAAALLHQLLARSPPLHVAAKAHLYLGLIAFNALEAEAAQRELRLAVETDPSIELPATVSPKARLAFAKAQREELARLTASPPLGARARRTAPAAAVEEPPPRGRTHALAWTLGALGLAAGVVAIVGGVEIASFNSGVNAVNAGSAPPPSSGLAASQRSAAQTWQIAAIACSVAAAAGLTAAAFTW
jgi:hypothetical protein